MGSNKNKDFNESNFFNSGKIKLENIFISKLNQLETRVNVNDEDNHRKNAIFAYTSSNVTERPTPKTPITTNTPNNNNNNSNEQ